MHLGLGLSHSTVSSLFSLLCESRPPQITTNHSFKRRARTHAHTLAPLARAGTQKHQLASLARSQTRVCAAASAASSTKYIVHLAVQLSSHRIQPASQGPSHCPFSFPPVSIADISRPPRQTIASPATWLPHSLEQRLSPEDLTTIICPRWSLPLLKGTSCSLPLPRSSSSALSSFCLSLARTPLPDPHFPHSRVPPDPWLFSLLSLNLAQSGPNGERWGLADDSLSLCI